MTFARVLGDRDACDYDDFVARARGGHYAQTRAWAKAFGGGTWRSSRLFLARVHGVVVGAAVVRGTRFLPVAMIERGPVVADPGDLERVLVAVARACRRRGVARLTAMPYWSGGDAVEAEAALRRARFHDVQARDGTHAVTLRVSLEGGDAALLAGSARKKLRYELRHAERSGLRVRQATAADARALAGIDGELAVAQRRRPRGAGWFLLAFDYLAEAPGVARSSSPSTKLR